MNLKNNHEKKQPAFELVALKKLLISFDFFLFKIIKLFLILYYY